LPGGFENGVKIYVAVERDVVSGGFEIDFRAVGVEEVVENVQQFAVFRDLCEK